jgi:hypothetical protein
MKSLKINSLLVLLILLLTNCNVTNQINDTEREWIGGNGQKFYE